MTKRFSFVAVLWLLTSATGQAQYTTMYGPTAPRPATPAAALAAARQQSSATQPSAAAQPAAAPTAAAKTNAPAKQQTTRQRPANARVAQAGIRPVPARPVAQGAPAAQASPVAQSPAASRVAQQMPSYAPTPVGVGTMPGWSGMSVNGTPAPYPTGSQMSAGPQYSGAQYGGAQYGGAQYSGNAVEVPATTQPPVADAGPIADDAGAGPYQGGYGSGGCGPGTWVRPLCWEKRAFGPHCHFIWNSTGDMPQHVPYFPHAHGYYYFRPYNVVHVLQQQEMAQRWGGDARNPYDNRMFERIYMEHEAAHLESVPTLPGEPANWPNGRR